MLSSDLGEFSGAMDCSPHAWISPAAADIGHPGVNVRVARVWVVRKERDCGHDLPRLAIAALWRVGLDPGLLDRVELLLAETLDGQDFLSAASLTGVMQDRVASPSMMTVQAPHNPAPQPNFVPTIPSSSRSAQSSGISGSTSSGDFPPVHEKIDHRPASLHPCIEVTTKESHDCRRPGWTRSN